MDNIKYIGGIIVSKYNKGYLVRNWGRCVIFVEFAFKKEALKYAKVLSALYDVPLYNWVFMEEKIVTSAINIKSVAEITDEN